jgi:hypothetical protein
MFESSLARTDLLRRGLRLEYLTVAWNVIEGVIAIGAGVVAGSIALIGFGIDSIVETVSGVVLTWRLVGVAFLLLAAYVAIEAIRALIGQSAPEASPVGIVLTSVSIGVMLWLAGQKRRTGGARKPRPPWRTPARRRPAGTSRSSRWRVSPSMPRSAGGGPIRSRRWSSLRSSTEKASRRSVARPRATADTRSLGSSPGVGRATIGR